MLVYNIASKSCLLMKMSQEIMLNRNFPPIIPLKTKKKNPELVIFFFFFFLVSVKLLNKEFRN